MELIENFLKNLGVGPRPLNDPFLENSHNSCKVFERKGVTIEDEEELCHEIMKEFPCNACSATFGNLLDYELHYHDSHHFVCAECKKWRPTNRLLEIHVQETHDNFFKVLAEKQPMYQCFVSECNNKFNNSLERTEHCRQVHAFPKNYRFDDSVKIKPTVSEKTSMEVDDVKPQEKKKIMINFGKNHKAKTFSKKNLCSNNSNNPALNVINTEEQPKFSSATMFIPRQVQQKTFANRLTGNSDMKMNVLESNSLMELGESLPNT